MVGSTYINCHLKQGAQPVTPGMLFGHATPAPEMSDDQMLAMMQAFTNAHNTKLKQQ